MIIIMSRDPNQLREELKKYAVTATVEAEYGDICVEGTITLAHHGTRSHQYPPCVYPNLRIENLEAVGISHMDLDTVGGIMAVMGIKPEVHWFWDLAGAVDINGIHRIEETYLTPWSGKIIQPEKQQIVSIWSFIGWQNTWDKAIPKNIPAVDMIDWYYDACEFVSKILRKDIEAMELGVETMHQQSRLNRRSYLDSLEYVLIRKSNSNEFVNHLYNSPNGEIFEAVVTWYEDTGEITVSTFEKNVDCKKFVQNHWGPEAGGHHQIAGSPRNKKLNVSEAMVVAKALEAEYKKFFR